MAKDIVKKYNKNPAISVVMSVYNGEKYLKEAIDSILNQTFKDFEFIIINDGSTDNSLRIINSYKDPRIVLISRSNKGLVLSLNEGINKAKGEYIARMDADDISRKDRLGTQVEFLDNNNDVGLVGSSMSVLSTTSQKKIDQYVLLGDSEIRQELMIRCPFVHGSTVFRKQIAFDVGLYDKNFWPAEDYDFWLRISLKSKVRNIYDTLYVYRDNENGTSRKNSDKQQAQTKAIKLIAYSKNTDLLRKNISITKYLKYTNGIGLIERISDNLKELIASEGFKKCSFASKIYTESNLIKINTFILIYKIAKKIIKIARFKNVKK